MEVDQQLCAVHDARWRKVAQRLKEPDEQRGFRHELAHIDRIINHDVGPVFGHDGGEWAPRWTSFVVANRLVEQAFKLIAPIALPKEIGHRLKSKWADVMDGSPQSFGQDVLGSLSSGYGIWQALFQSPWPSLGELLSHLEQYRNAKEYVLVDPDEPGARIEPLLPLALADIAAMSWGALWYMGRQPFNVTGFGVRLGDTTVGRLRHIIRQVFKDKGGVNLNLALANEKYGEHGYLRLWSILFHTLRPYKEIHRDRLEHDLKYRDGSPNDVIGYDGAPRWVYALPQARDVLAELFNGDGGLAEAHADVAEALLNTRDWRLQFFINMSECRPVELVDGTLTDTTKGAWRLGVW